jgi:hypothetical protein
LAWAICWLVLLTAFPDRRDRYAMPMHAGLAITAASFLTGRSRRASHALRRVAPIAAGAGIVLAVLPIRFQRAINPQWPTLTAWLKGHAPDGAWEGAFAGAPAARVYLGTGAWPRTTRDSAGRLINPPPRGAILLYHRRGGWAPGPGETIVWREGDLSATRLDGQTWSPVSSPDPGE